MSKYTVFLAALAILCSGCRSCQGPKGDEKGTQEDAGGKEEPVEEPAVVLAKEEHVARRSIQPAGDGGYIVAAQTSSKGAGSSDMWILKLDSKGEVQWDRILGGPGEEEACSAAQDGESGYLVVGTTRSKEGANKGIVVVKLDEKGQTLWEKSYGQERMGEAHAAAQTADGGHVVAGSAASKSGGGFQAWILKLDGDGQAEWDRTYGEGADHAARSIQQTMDGGYFVGGLRRAGDNTDSWVMKLDKDGNVEWERTYGEMKYEAAFSVRQTEGGRYLVAGESQANEEGTGNVWILMLDKDGAIEWDRQYGGLLDDRAYDVVETPGGGCVLAGIASRKLQGDQAVVKAAGGKAEGDTHVTDCWVLELDKKGNVAWERKYGGSDDDACLSIMNTQDGGYVLAGRSASRAEGKGGVWVIKLDGSGELEWEKAYAN